MRKGNNPKSLHPSTSNIDINNQGSISTFNSQRPQTPHDAINAKDTFGLSKLHYAVRTGDVATILQLRQEPNININIQNDDGDTPLHDAINFTDVRSVRTLLESPKINIHIKNNKNETPLDLLLKNEQLKKNSSISSLIDLSLFQRDTEGRTILHTAAEAGDITEIKFS